MTLSNLPLFQSRDSALDALELSNADYIARWRQIADELLETQPTVTVNDLRDRLPMPPGMEPRAMGAVLRKPRFVKVGFVESSRPECHQRPIAVFARGQR